ncbi:MAG TPA: MBL fold metallo-hydrolase, partial [Patescibacteria group bacterium]
MIITWLGHSAFKIESKDITLVTDPYDPKIGFKFPKITADIVTISHDHFDHAYAEGVAGEPFIIDSAGEYEIKEVFVMGLPSFHDKKEGADRGGNIIYKIELENITIAHLGDLGHVLTDEQTEKLQGVDILMIPV